MVNNEFAKGEFVVYASEGLCLVEDIKYMSFIKGEESKKHYIIKPVRHNSAVIYIPYDSEKLMGKIRRAMTKEEIDAMLLNIKGKELLWEEDRKLRTEQCHDILLRGVSDDLLLMISCIYLKKYDLLEENKVLSASDSKFLETAARLVDEEFSHALGIPAVEVGEYIRKTLGM